MEKTLLEQINLFKEKNDLHQYRILLNIADSFIQKYSNGVTNDSELDLGILLLRELISLTYLSSLRQYENDFDLDREIRHKKIKVFKLCIPSSHEKLRGITELLLGMKENSVG
jgi:hypothetical protein